jgi:tRNA(fMet)-specific endonuclease VapC
MDALSPVFLPFDDAAAIAYEHLLRKRTEVGAMDLKIAAIARATDELLISANLRHFRKIPGLTVEDWTRP